MELIAAAIAFYAVFLPVFLYAELAAPRPGFAIRRLPVTPEEAARRYLAANPLKPRARLRAANDDYIRQAA